MRIIRIDDQTTYNEVIDGQQRINTVQAFYNNELKLPKSLKDIHPDLPDKTFEELPSDIAEFFDELSYDVDIVKQIDDPTDPEHQEIATEIFWRLQQGESLNYMEVAHARLSSLVRNFVVKYSDDITFNFQSYKPQDDNPDKHNFFKVISRNNNRMQHLALLTRLLIIEENNGPADIKDTNISDFIDTYKQDDGIGNFTFEEHPSAQKVLSLMNLFYRVFKNDPLYDKKSGGLPIFKVEYFIISTYLLLRHLNEHYVFEDEEKKLFREFVYDFYDRWHSRKEEDRDILIFSDNRQQTSGEIETRQRILRQLFYEFAQKKQVEIRTKDENRSFSEAQRIKIYRAANGLCSLCIEEGKPEKEAYVTWSNYETDHVLPHSKGGETVIENGQLLCRRHNRIKGSRI